MEINRLVILIALIIGSITLLGLIIFFLKQNSKTKQQNKQELDIQKNDAKQQNQDYLGYLIVIAINMVAFSYIIAATSWFDLQKKHKQEQTLQATQKELINTLEYIAQQQQDYYEKHQVYTNDITQLSINFHALLTIYYRIKTNYIDANKQTFWIIGYPINIHAQDSTCQTFVLLHTGEKMNITGDYKQLTQPGFWDNITKEYQPDCWQL